MAKRTTAEIVIKGKDKASPALRKITAAANKTAESFAVVAKATAAAGVAFAAMTAKAVADSNAQETALRKLDHALVGVGSSYAEAEKSIAAFASVQQATTRFGDDETQKVLTQLIQLTGSYSDSTLRAASVIEDMAESGMSLDGATRAVGQAMAGNVQALGRYVPSLRGMAQAQVDALSAQERESLVLDALEGQYGGMAKAIDPVAQKLANLGNTLGDVSEAFGLAVKSGGGLEAGMDNVLTALQDLETWISANHQFISDTFVSMVKPAAMAFGLFAMSVKGLIQSFQLLSPIVDHMSAGMATAEASWIRLTGTQDEWFAALDRSHAAWKLSNQSWDDAESGITKTEQAYVRLMAVLAGGMADGGLSGAAVKTGRSARRKAGTAATAAAGGGGQSGQEFTFSESEGVDTALTDDMLGQVSGNYFALQERIGAIVQPLDEATAAQKRFNEAMRQFNEVGKIASDVGQTVVAVSSAMGAGAATQAKIQQAVAIAIAATKGALAFAEGVHAAAIPATAYMAPGLFFAAAKYAAVAGAGVAGFAGGSSGSADRGRGRSGIDIGTPSPRIGSFASTDGGGGASVTNIYNVQGALVREQEAGAWAAAAIGDASDAGMARASEARNG